MPHTLKTSVDHQARGEFLDSFHQLQAAFAAVQSEVQQQERALMQNQADVSAELEQLARATQNQLNPEHPLSQMCEQWLANIAGVRQRWLQAAQSFDKGTRLRQKQGDSLLIYVYGKVNAGKSSFGNHIATGCAEPNAQQVAALAEKGLYFAMHEVSGAALEQSLTQGFEVDRKECTSAVQYFTLPGLTWVDSPGLHSKTARNGELARQYAQSADVVVYVMNAEHAARETDMKEIGELLSMGKPVVFVLTRADEPKPAVIDGQLVSHTVMYSQDDRQEQERYVMQTLSRHFGQHPGLAQAQIMSVSVRCAEISDTPEALEDSGIPHFLRTMQLYIKQESVRIKQATPKRNLAAFARRLLAGTEQMAEQQADIQSELTAQQDEVERRYQTMSQQLTLQLSDIIARAMQNYSGDNAALSSQIAADLQQKATGLIQVELEQQLHGMEQNMASAITFDSSDALPGFEHEYSSFNFSDRGYKRAWGGAGGGALGAGVGFFLAGPMGAVVGSILGGAVGEGLGRAFSKDSTRSVLIGDNRFSIEQAAYQLFSTRIADTLEQSYRTPMLEILQQMEQNIRDSRRLLEQFCQRWQPLTEPLTSTERA
jgi:tRNA U34 5-carboxymethylaminomethyl modifying GTPase MnmE/TrmE